ncbi:hypothetical protein [Longitalea arenae]|uniref:hypothetical protein n=1 Tax=Longitalea arenae TaxID=2812558 RepID=UPI0019672C4A|nr:hypothetical protein [Longitalea arenae]
MIKTKGLILLGVLLTGLNSCEEVLERSLVDKTVVLQAPVNNGVPADSAVSFYWEELEGATEYQLQVVAPRFDSLIKVVADTPVTGQLLVLELDRGVYQWRVRAKNNSTVSNYSEAWNLTIQ